MTILLPAQFMPKKAEVQLVKCEGKINVVMVDDEPFFYNGATPSPSPHCNSPQPGPVLFPTRTGEVSPLPHGPCRSPPSGRRTCHLLARCFPGATTSQPKQQSESPCSAPQCVTALTTPPSASCTSIPS